MKTTILAAMQRWFGKENYSRFYFPDIDECVEALARVLGRCQLYLQHQREGASKGVIISLNRCHEVIQSLAAPESGIDFGVFDSEDFCIQNNLDVVKEFIKEEVNLPRNAYIFANGGGNVEFRFCGIQILILLIFVLFNYW